MLGNETLHQFPNSFTLHSLWRGMILAIVRHVSCVHTALLMNSHSDPWLYLQPRLAFGIFQLLLQVKQLELKRG